MGGGGGGGSKNPSTLEERELRAEQAELIRLQRDITQQGLETKTGLDPILFESAGFTPTFAGPDDKLTVAKQAEITALEQELSLSPFERILKTRREGSPFKSNAFIQQEIKERQEELQALQRQRITGLERKPDPFQAQIDEIRELSQERIQKALAGELPVSPRLTRDIDRRQRDLEEGLRRQFGRDFRTSTPAQEVLQNAQEQELSILDAARRGDLTFAEQLGLAQEQREQQRIGGVIARTQNIPLSNQQFSNALANVSQGFNIPISSLRNERLQNISPIETRRTTTGRIVGGGVGAAGGALTGAAVGSVVPGIGTVAGAVVGGVLGAAGGAFG